MAPTARKSTGKVAKAPVQTPEMSVYDFESSGSSAGADDESGEDSFVEQLEKEVGTELQNMLTKFQGDIKKVLQTKRRKYQKTISTSIKNIQQKVDRVLKLQHEQRQELYREYSHQFGTLVRLWNVDVRRVKEQGEKLACLFQQQQNAFQQSQIVHSQNTKAFKDLCEHFMENLHDLEENQGNVVITEQKELRKEMAILQTKLMMETREEEKAGVRKSLLSLLFS